MLRLLKVLGAGNAEASDQMSDILAQVCGASAACETNGCCTAHICPSRYGSSGPASWHRVESRLTSIRLVHRWPQARRATGMRAMRSCTRRCRRSWAWRPSAACGCWLSTSSAASWPTRWIPIPALVAQLPSLLQRMYKLAQCYAIVTAPDMWLQIAAGQQHPVCGLEHTGARGGRRHAGSAAAPCHRRAVREGRHPRLCSALISSMSDAWR